MIQKLKTWWQVQTGEEETPLDGDAPVWVISMLFHLCLMIALAFVMVGHKESQVSLTIAAPIPEEEKELEMPQEFYFSEQESEEIGANSINGDMVALSVAPIIADVSDVPSPVDMEVSDVSTIQINDAIQAATGLNYDANLAVKGAMGSGTTGALGAIDRITHQILLSLEERKTTVVWLFDQSGSLARQRESIHDRFDKIYDELGVIEAAGNKAFAKHEDKPLLSSVVAFGDKVTLRTPKPTDNLEEIKKAVAEIDLDTSGTERVFSAVWMAANEYKGDRIPQPETNEPRRNVMIVVFTDERGDDLEGLDETVKMCRRYEMPVYVVGVPAPFGREETLVKWVDLDPEFDQTPQWGRVNQGPESFLPERLKLSFSATDDERNPIDSGFGPFALTRLSIETGGLYFAVHPNRNVNKAVSRNETAAYSAHLEHFFDPQVMRRYQPDYVSRDEYMRRVSSNKARAALVQAAQMTWLNQFEAPTLRFVRRDEAFFANALTEAQKDAAKLEPKIAMIYEVMKMGEADRPQETIPRWQAGYDLAMGRLLAIKARTEAYNAMLAAAKRGLKTKDPKSNTWTLKPAAVTEGVGSQIEKMGEDANTYLKRVVDEHPGTPWALLAQRELDNPIGWKWDESYTDLNPRPQGDGNGNAPPGVDDARRMIERGPPKRALPKL